MASPVRTVERIYERCGREMSEAHRAAIGDWLANNPQTKHGAHKYAMDEFGLSPETTNRQFRDYVERFGFGYGLRPAPVE